jgi:Dyp-type peroxidase family
MKSLHELTEPIPQDALKGLHASPYTHGELSESLSHLQGNILHGHGRCHAVHLFLHFQDGQQTEVKDWIKGLAEHMTSAQQQLDEPTTQQQIEEPTLQRGMFRSFFLSASGYEYLGFDFPRISPLFDDEAFPKGMKKARRRLHDSAPEDWEEGYRREIHAMLLLAHDREEELTQEIEQRLDEVKAHADVCAVERGKVLRNAQGKHIEHFGFRDSRSHPLFFESDIEWERQKGGGIDVWNPGAGPASVLVPDPYGRRERDRNGLLRYRDSGSYLVFRKLEQNVCAFKEYEAALANVLGLTAADATRAGALLVGRFADGTPLVSPHAAGQPGFVPNNFTYDDDEHGQKCPFQAHIRKANPRQKGGWIPRIVRRGITYGERDPNLNDRPSAGVGILFLCYQKNIKAHFEFIQSQWANNPNFPEEETGIDPLIGQPENGQVGQHRWPARWDDPRAKHRPFPLPQKRFVTLKGGEYFFAPSKHFLRHLGEG